MMRDGKLARAIHDQVERMRFTVTVDPAPHCPIIHLLQWIHPAVSGLSDA